MNSLNRWMQTLVLLALLGGVSTAAYFWASERVKSAIYAHQLEQLGAEFSQLQDAYQTLIKETTLTQLEVTDQSIAVLIRGRDGSLQRVHTPFLPQREVYVDYVVSGGRIWIRRIFDSATPPSEAMVLDPVWQSVDWQDPRHRFGQAVYRSLQPGLWEIRVTGNGAMSLAPAQADAANVIAYAPQIESITDWQQSKATERGSIGPREVWQWLADLAFADEKALTSIAK